MGLEYGHLNPRAATHIVLEQFPTLASTLAPPVATESMMELANVFRGDFAKRQGWGWHDFEQWGLFFDTIKQIGQVTKQISPEDVLSNDYVPAANDFDHAKVQADADGVPAAGGVPGDRRGGDPRAHLSAARSTSAPARERPKGRRSRRGDARSRTRVRMNDAADEPSKPTSAEPEFREISDEELQRILADHKKWVEAEDKTGLDHLRADLSLADLRGRDLDGHPQRGATAGGRPRLGPTAGGRPHRSPTAGGRPLREPNCRGPSSGEAQLQGAWPQRGPTAGGTVFTRRQLRAAGNPRGRRAGTGALLLTSPMQISATPT